MSEFTLSTNADLASELFLKSLQNRELHPLNDVTNTDFILEGGITLALRASDYGLVLKVMKRSEEHTSELQSLMRISYAVFCLKKKKRTTRNEHKNLQANLIHKQQYIHPTTNKQRINQYI